MNAPMLRNAFVLAKRTPTVARPSLLATRFLSSLQTEPSVTAQASELLPPTLASPTPGKPLPLFIPPAEDPLLTLLTSEIMKHGKRDHAARIVTGTLEYLHSITLVPTLPLLREAILLASPSVKVVTFRKPSKNVLMPTPLGEKHKAKLALKWIMKASDKRPYKKVEQRVAHEILAILRGESEVLRKKEEMHKSAVVNRSNARNSR